MAAAAVAMAVAAVEARDGRTAEHRSAGMHMHMPMAAHQRSGIEVKATRMYRETATRKRKAATHECELSTSEGLNGSTAERVIADCCSTANTNGTKRMPYTAGPQMERMGPQRLQRRGWCARSHSEHG